MKAIKAILYIFVGILIFAISGGTFAAVSYGLYNQEQRIQKAVIILPGLFASGLYDTATGEGVWDPLENTDLQFGDIISPEGLNLENIFPLLFNEELMEELNKLFAEEGAGDADSLFNLMAMNEEGSPIVSTVKPVPWTSESRLKFGVINAQKEMYDEMQRLYGEQYEVQCFNYDFRIDNRISAIQLEDYINQQGYEEVILVSHSNGGQVAAIYLARSEANRDKVKKYISYNAPYYGSFSAVHILEDVSGMLEGAVTMMESILPGSSDTVVKVFQKQFMKLLNVWTAYQLLPSYELIAAPHNGEQAGFFLDGQRIEFDSQEDLWEFYCSRPWAKMTNGELRPAMSQWLDYKNSLTVLLPNGERVLSTTLVDTVYFTGNGMPSLYQSFYRTDEGQTEYLYSENHLLGDGTVSFSSSVAMLTDESRIVVCDGHNHYGVVNNYQLTAAPETKAILDAYLEDAYQESNKKWYNKLWRSILQ
ncbi:MAG: hypothetical protein PHI19_06845 [Clostridia bacterium]|nr:hypothetical protein [Clostridia bacterium]